jgi:hypothetical protein|tara:strand:- start:315 stop:680 length:366 start_codon:yes stop_codon:yes gene_type:complete
MKLFPNTKQLDLPDGWDEPRYQRRLRLYRNTDEYSSYFLGEMVADWGGNEAGEAARVVLAERAAQDEPIPYTIAKPRKCKPEPISTLDERIAATKADTERKRLESLDAETRRALRNYPPEY